MGLGLARGTNAVSLADARLRAAPLHAAVRAGRDPLTDRVEASALVRAAAQTEAAYSMTFSRVAEAYIASHEAAWRNAKHEYQWRQSLETYAYPHFGDVLVADVVTAHVLAALEPIWRTKAETAGRLRGGIEASLNYGKVRGWRSGENPATWRGHLAQLLPSHSKIAKPKHHAALPWAEVASFIVALRQREGMGAKALEFAILTAARSGEVLGATWCEIDLKAKVWTVPANRMKASREHRVPLSAPAIDLLRELGAFFGIDPDDYVFPAPAPKRDFPTCP